MADDKIKPLYSEPPKHPSGRLDKKKIKQLFDDSKHVEWVPFCNSYNWPAHSLRNRLPVAKWVKDKKKEIAEARVEELSDALFDQEFKWRTHVLKSLEEYPKVIDLMKDIVVAQMNYYAELINEDQRHIAHAKANGLSLGDLKLNMGTKIKTGDLINLGATLERTQQAKYRSLLLDATRVKMALTPPSASDADEDIDNKDKDWTIKLLGVDGESTEIMTKKDMETLMLEYLDQPAPEDPEEALKRQKELEGQD